jgi:hypothetical protein
MYFYVMKNIKIDKDTGLYLRYEVDSPNEKEIHLDRLSFNDLLNLKSKVLKKADQGLSVKISHPNWSVHVRYNSVSNSYLFNGVGGVFYVTREAMNEIDSDDFLDCILKVK